MTWHDHERHGAEAVWTPCATCWGQRRILVTGDDGGLVPATCPGCLGVGERLADCGCVPAPAPETT
jgi:hypothetical protein